MIEPKYGENIVVLLNMKINIPGMFPDLEFWCMLTMR